MLRIALTAVAALEVGLPVVLYAFRHRLMFFPDRRPEAWQGLPSVGAGVEAALLEVVRPDGRRLAAYEARPAGAKDGGPVCLYLHGNAGNLGLRADLCGAFVRGTGVRTLMVEYSGFGATPGSPTESDTIEDGLAAFDHLVAGGVPPSRIVIYGESIGGAVALAVAAKRKPAGVVAQSSFSSLSSMALRVYPWLPLSALLVRGSFRSADNAGVYGGPVLVVHGDRDSIVPLAEGKALREAIGEKGELLVIPGADHNDLVGIGGRDYLRTLGERFRRWTTPR